MNTTQRIYGGFAIYAMAIVAMPAFSWAAGVSPSEQVQNAASTGSRANLQPSARPGYKWVPSPSVAGKGDLSTQGAWVRDEASPHWRKFDRGDTTVYADGPLDLKDSEGKSIPIDPSAYPIGTTRK